MSEVKGKDTIESVTTALDGDSLDEKRARSPRDVPFGHIVTAKHAEVALNLTEADFLSAQKEAEKLSLQDVKEILRHGYDLHEFDPNFPSKVLGKIKVFLEDNQILETPEKHAELIEEMRLEAAILTSSSPYAEVRAVVHNGDDVNIPCSTIRSWIIGLIFVVVVAFMNQLFSVRQPSISVGPEVVQLLCYPVGKAFEKFLPDIGVTLFGVRHSLNPDEFSRKEHMLITIMATGGSVLPSSRYIIFTQFLKKYFNQPYSGSFGYQILLALSTDLMGYGLAGIMRKILVYPSYCLYPKSLVTIALNNSLHRDKNTPVQGPAQKTWTISRLRFFMWAFVSMFIYFWFPNYIFTALSAFNWIAWIAPNNIDLSAITGFSKGAGINPLPTFDWNIISSKGDPLVIPYRAVVNKFFGVLVGAFMVIGMWYTNAFHTSYLPINTSTLYTNNATTYNVSKILDSRGWLDEAKYQAYSPAFMSSASLTMYYWFFALYAATITHTYVYHRNEIVQGFKNLFRRLKSSSLTDDVHNKLMKKYPEVSEWWYLGLNLIAIALGIAVITGWQTCTTVGVIFFGILLSFVYIIPAGVIYATTGIDVELNVIAEFIGGAIQPGNALAMNFFKCYGYVTTAHALNFVNDLKLAHYTKIPPRHVFWAQVVATVISALVCTGTMNFQLNKVEDICESTQAARFTCPGVNVYFSAAVQFGSMGAKKVFGSGGQYTILLSAFPIGLSIPLILYLAQRKLPKEHWARKIHPVAFLSGGLVWTPPYNVSYIWPAIPFGYLSMVYLKRRYLAFWSKYNYVLSAAWAIAIAISALVMYFALEYSGIELNWWGNGANSGCESKACVRMKLPKGEYFGPRIGEFA
ncbi:hypothetical protein M409DRAFT_15752 [Zasmidium cellare ATCC 36951]|uniref:OPT family small oligopeptide transporter n=1 Tax=Zasmidium cellare ATCC 36951 TaxID=1080233 RepID=A0A6A6D274_ZASCE|nr:uncharacterized protein M409DRAFT_15752 [Zasmidium cellare ATCC 36951]KAF2173471.1 hypothetical protein M409DRAFT_15752 [Zasmidium cellare ATCC 36951]